MLLLARADPEVLARAHPQVTSPLCIDCKFHRRDYNYGMQCARKKQPIPHRDPVDGVEWERTMHIPLADDERKASFFGRTCGPSGKHFQPA